MTEEVRSDFDSYYSIGFRAISRVDPEGTFRITVRDRSLRVRARRAFTAHSTSQRAERRALANLYDPISESDIALRVSTGTSRPYRNNRIVSLEISFPRDALLEKDGQSHFSIYVTTADVRGGVSPVVQKSEAIRSSEQDPAAIVRYSVDVVLRDGGWR